MDTTQDSLLCFVPEQRTIFCIVGYSAEQLTVLCYAERRTNNTTQNNNFQLSEPLTAIIHYQPWVKLNNVIGDCNKNIKLDGKKREKIVLYSISQ